MNDKSETEIPDSFVKVGDAIGFSNLAEELRKRLGVEKKGAIAKAKKNNAGDMDATAYTRFRTGQRVPGWREVYKQGKLKLINKNRQEIKDYIHALLDQVPVGSIEAQPDELIALANNLLLAAEYSPLNASRNEDDAKLIRRLTSVCRSGFYRDYLNKPSNSDDKELTAILEQVRLLAQRRKKISTSDNTIKSDDTTEKAECLIFKTGIAETERYKRVAEVERELKGPRLYFAPYLTNFALPMSVRQEFIRVNNITGPDRDLYFQSRQSRLENWLVQLKEGYLQRDIYEQEAIENWIKGRQFQGILMSPEEVNEQIENLCSYLDTYKTFEVAISPIRLNFNFEIKAAQVVFVQGRRDYPADHYDGLLHLKLEGNSYMSYFTDLFNQFWEQSNLKNRKEVQNWLRETFHNCYPNRKY